MDEPDNWGRHAGELTLQDYVAIFVRRRWLVLGILLATIVAAAAWNVVAPRSYESVASVLLRTNANEQLFPSVPNAQRNDFLRRESAEFEYASSTAFARQANAITPEDASVSPRIDEDGNSSLLDFVARAPSPLEAQQGAAAWATTYLDLRRSTAVDRITVSILDTEAQIAELEIQKAEILLPLKPIDDALLSETDSDTISRLTTQRLSLTQALEDELLPVSIQLRDLSQNVARLRIAESLVNRDNVSELLSTEAPLGRQVAPNIARNMALAGVLGALLAAGAALVMESLNSAIRSGADLERIAPSIQVLAQIPDLPKDVTSPSQLASQNGTPYAEALERLVSALLYQRVGRPGDRMKVLITSALPGEGKTTITSNLGRRLSFTNVKTVLIDADLRRPNLHNALGMPRGLGLTELLHRGEPLARHFSPIPDAPNVMFLSAGAPTDDAASLLRQSFRPAIDGLPLSYDLLMVDAPPVLAVTDAEVLVESVDAVVLVVRAGSTKTAQVQQTLRQLAALNATIAGFVLVGVKDDAAKSYSYSYHAYDSANADRSTAPAPVAQVTTSTNGARQKPPVRKGKPPTAPQASNGTSKTRPSQTSKPSRKN